MRLKTHTNVTYLIVVLLDLALDLALALALDLALALVAPEMLDDDLEVVIGIIVASLFTGPFEDDAVRIAMFFVIGIGVGAGVGLGRNIYIYEHTNKYNTSISTRPHLKSTSCATIAKYFKIHTCNKDSTKRIHVCVNCTCKQFTYSRY